MRACADSVCVQLGSSPRAPTWPSPLRTGTGGRQGRCCCAARRRRLTLLQTSSGPLLPGDRTDLLDRSRSGHTYNDINKTINVVHLMAIHFSVTRRRRWTLLQTLSRRSAHLLRKPPSHRRRLPLLLLNRRPAESPLLRHSSSPLLRLAFPLQCATYPAVFETCLKQEWNSNTTLLIC